VTVAELITALGSLEQSARVVLMDEGDIEAVKTVQPVRVHQLPYAADYELMALCDEGNRHGCHNCKDGRSLEVAVFISHF
jgi:sulfur relay (sulfurtransferase) DsrF/TusC family protein